MKVVFVISRADTLGGAHVHVADMAEWLRANGHTALVIVGGEGPYCEHLRGKRVPFSSSRFLRRTISPVHDIRAIGELRGLLKDAAADLISLHSSKAGILGRVAAARLGVPVVFTAHGWSFTDGVSRQHAALYRRLERLTGPLADCIITVSDYDRLLARRAGITAGGGIVTIHNGMPDVDAMADPGRVEGPIRLIMVARLDNQKDHRTLLAALATMQERDWVLDLVGDGPLEERVRAAAAEFGVTRRVNVLGLRDDVDTLLARSHICVLTTHWEGFPRTILEAMRARLPVVATAVGGIPESIENGMTGYLVERSDSAALASRLAQLMDSPEERVRLGTAGRKRYEERFRFERMAGDTLAVYEELLRGRRCASV